jgi:hypothetical protein
MLMAVVQAALRHEGFDRRPHFVFTDIDNSTRLSIKESI